MSRALKLQDRARCQRRFCANDIEALARLTGGRIDDDRVPEPLINSLFSYLLGVELPGSGTQYLKQSTTFLRPSKIGDLLDAEVTITRLRPEKNLVDLSTICRNATGDVVAQGRALVWFEDYETRDAHMPDLTQGP
jgi:3-hydroxybutyryl-CoA dehydratase